MGSAKYQDAGDEESSSEDDFEPDGQGSKARSQLLRGHGMLGQRLFPCVGLCGLGFITILVVRWMTGDARRMATLLNQVQAIDNSTDVVQAWREYQGKLSEKLKSDYHTVPPRQEKYKVLIVAGVHDEQKYVDVFDANINNLGRNAAGDNISAALFHIDGTNEKWRGMEWYNRVVVSTHFGPGCKPYFWSLISPEMSAEYDYLWLMDEDMTLDFFSWDFYRTVLSMLDPIVSQPSVLPKAPGLRSTAKKQLRMRFPTDDSFSMAFEVIRGEVQAPVISTQIWPAVHKRLEGNNLTSCWFVDSFWDITAGLDSAHCGGTGSLVVNAAPMRHMDYHNIFSGTKCSKGVEVNNRPISATEESMVVEALSGRGCAVPADWAQKCQDMPLKMDLFWDETFAKYAVSVPGELLMCQMRVASAASTGRTWNAPLVL